MVNWEKIFATFYTDKELISLLFKEHFKIERERNKNSKTYKDINRHFFRI